ncbi:hypothetical protein GCM10008956_15150 [Deinococcus arenae]|uniref:Uncharacterized protein n=1 Tax=Deinococcus arenae TaxID=1452751 RepID=A0A8H9L963_9DEIO|nr:hypothetical protein [Deinococcus arenae]GGM39674.1 hypothetical protein GCM10008956_15150 [Deinococcus arenae]
MAISMQSSKGQSSGDTNRFEGDPGTYVFTLKEIIIDEGSDFDDKTKTFPQARLVWEDQDGDTFSDSFVRIPLGFRLNDKAKWTNRLSALVGRPLTDDDAARVSIDLGPDIQSYDDLAAAVGEVTDSGRKAFLKVLALDFDGETLFGRAAQLTLGVNAKGYNTCAAAGASPMPTSGGKKKKAPAATGEAEPLMTAPSAPPARRNPSGDADYGY